MAQPYVKKDDDHDDELEYSPFMGIEKGAVLQEARVFNDAQVDPRRCSQVITKLLYLLNQGESFTKVEATEVFFSVTKLFQSKDTGLRRMVYLIIKELSPSSDEVIIVTSSLMKDMNSKIDMYRANAIRVLCRIIDGTLLTQIERYLKQAIVDKNPVVSSAALVSGLHLLKTNPEIVKRWSNEVQEGIQSRSALVQFHALALLHQLFQSKDTGLRRMVYLIIKELSPSSDEVIIVTSSLMKDMNSKIDMYRANAIRVLCRIIDGTLLTQIERYLKQAIVDKNPVVSSAALVSGLHLLKTNPEIVKRWSNEVQEGIQSRSALVQFHALALLHQIRQNDRLAVSKLVGSLTRGSVRSPLAQCLLIRYTSQVIRDMSNHGQSGERPFYEFLESCLRHKAEMVILEAARAITELDGVTSRELTPAITVLQLFLSSPRPVLRFAAVRTLNKELDGFRRRREVVGDLADVNSDEWLCICCVNIERKLREVRKEDEEEREVDGDSHDGEEG
ncbi:hypothetical protein F2Q68_00028882 [Brassica cretica]|uniref:Clathrin/coatomer adaptor adaptin-like N-terminal domain-containing protein n=1 Tax=Brassica cretica TaxID=69181 RepID=A0A8S9G729_BRACR|nr:hypothetical protein F2Q68_00028882 [Brassica cretica]